MFAQLAWATYFRIGQIVDIPPAPTDEEQLRQMRINFQALIISIVFVAAIALLAYLLNKRAGKKRYAAHQAQLAAEGRLGRSGALTEIANNGGKPTFVNDDDAAAAPTERLRGSIFGEGYTPYGKDGTNAPGV
jgi:hypothetical protein